MKVTYKIAAVLAGASLLLSSCAVDGVYGSVGVAGPGYNASVAWSNASYDANGFPIFGYYYGQPVYGYTPAGAAVLSFAALTALCFVPHWGPAPWYHGPWHYPPHIHRVSAPPRYPSGHRPHMRPHGGLNAPIHRNPNSVLRPPHHKQGPSWAGKAPFNPGRPNHAPGNMSGPGRPNHAPGNMSGPGRPNHAPGNMSGPGRPNHTPGNMSGPGRPNHAPGNMSGPGRPNHAPGNMSGSAKPNRTPGNVSGPGASNHTGGNMHKPAMFSRPNGAMPGANHPNRMGGNAIGGHANGVPRHGGHRH